MRLHEEEIGDYAGLAAREGLIEAGWHDVPRLRPASPPPPAPERPGLAAHWWQTPGGELHCIWTAMQRKRVPRQPPADPPPDDDQPGPAQKDAPSFQTLAWVIAVIAFVLLLNATGTQLAAIQTFQPVPFWE